MQLQQLSADHPILSVYTPTDFPLLHYFQVNFTYVISAINISVFFLKDKDYFKNITIMLLLS